MSDLTRIPMTDLEGVFLTHLIQTRTVLDILLCLAEACEDESGEKTIKYTAEQREGLKHTANGLREIVKTALEGAKP